jgi:cyclase
MYRAAILAIGLTVAAVAAPALAQAPARPLVVTPVRGGVYTVTGGHSGGSYVNTGFVVGDKGVIAIDPQMYEDSAKAELAEIARVTPKPVTTVILTHSDPDHTFGLPNFPPGVAVIAQENVKTEMQQAIATSLPRPTPAGMKDYLPTHTIRRSETMTIDGVKVVLTHLAPAHTDGDLIIFFPAQKVVFLGDLSILDDASTHDLDPYPVIHLNKFGSSLGWIRAMKAALALDADTFVSGHGRITQNRAAQQAAVTAVERRRAQIKTLFDQGKTLAQIKTALHDPTVGAAGGPRFATFVDTTYEELLRD